MQAVGSDRLNAAVIFDIIHITKAEFRTGRDLPAK